ncbi:MAG: DUF4142 domain-containing protein [Steroidobacteraceae bacterium]
MRTWKSVAFALAVATTLSAYADDRTNSSSGNTPNSAADTRSGSSTNAAMPDRTESTTSGTSSSSTPAAGASSSDMMSDHSHMTGSTAATRNDPELQNLTTEKFFNKAAAAGMKEVQAAELALRSSKSDQVKSFARQMVSDHTKQNSRLTTLAAQNNVQVLKDLPAKDKADLDALRAATGSTFDTTFSQQMRTDHEKAVALFQSCANGNKIASDVRKFCRDSLPTLEEHNHAAGNLETRPNTTRAASTDE